MILDLSYPNLTYIKVDKNSSIKYHFAMTTHSCTFTCTWEGMILRMSQNEVDLKISKNEAGFEHETEWDRFEDEVEWNRLWEWGRIKYVNSY